MEWPKGKKFPTQAIIPAQGNWILDIRDVQTLLHDAASCPSWKKGKLDIIEEPTARFHLFPPACISAFILPYICEGQKLAAVRNISWSKSSNCFSISFNWKGKSSCRKVLHRLEHSTPTYKSFGGHIEEICDATTAVCATKLQEAVSELKTFLRTADPELESASVLDIEVTCDGTWAKRGYISWYGCICRISWYWESARWQWKMHHEAECSANFSNSSKAMEAAGAVQLWKRSIEKNGLQYTSFVGDWDSASHKSVVDAKPYGEAVQIEKEDCVGHVQKE